MSTCHNVKCPYMVNPSPLYWNCVNHYNFSIAEQSFDAGDYRDLELCWHYCKDSNSREHIKMSLNEEKNSQTHTIITCKPYYLLGIFHHFYQLLDINWYVANMVGFSHRKFPVLIVAWQLAVHEIWPYSKHHEKHIDSFFFFFDFFFFFGKMIYKLQITHFKYGFGIIFIKTICTISNIETFNLNIFQH